VALWAAACLLAGCAVGYAPELSEADFGTPPTLPAEDMSSGSAGSPPPSTEPYTGDPCMMGQSEACTCEAGGMGTRVCRFDVRSPTQGTFGECGSCMEPPTGGTAGMSGTGGSGTGGSASSGTGGSGTGGSGTGGSGTGGSSAGTGGSSSGTGGSSGSTPPPPASSGGRPGWCIFVPVPIPGIC
jgi:hypothetical protein